MKRSRESIMSSRHSRHKHWFFKPMSKAKAVKPKLAQRKPGGRFISGAEAMSLVRAGVVGILNAGAEITLRPGVTLRRVKSGVSSRFQLLGE